MASAIVTGREGTRSVLASVRQILLVPYNAEKQMQAIAQAADKLHIYAFSFKWKTSFS